MTRSIRFLLSSVLLGCLAAALLPAGALAAFGPVSSFGTLGSGAGQFKAPGKLDIAADGSVYLADTGNNRVDVFSGKGAFAFAFGKGVNPSGTGNPDVCTAQTGCVAGASLTTAGSLPEVDDVAVAHDGDIYVADHVNNRVDVFTAQGGFKFAFGETVNTSGTGKPDVCTAATGCLGGVRNGSAGSISPRALSLDAGDGVYVVGANNRIDVFTKTGTFFLAFGKEVSTFGGDVCLGGTCRVGSASEVAGGFIEPVDVDVNNQEEVLVLDKGANRVDSYSTGGSFRSAFGFDVRVGGGGTCTVQSGCQMGGFGNDAGEIFASTAIAADPSGHIYVAHETNRVEDFGVDGTFSRAFGAGVIDHQKAFQVCTEATGCRSGLKTPIAGATGIPVGVGVNAAGEVYVVERDQNRIERFGEPEPVVPSGGGTKTSPSPAPAPPAPIKRAAGKLRLGKLTLNRKAGTAALTVAVSGPGTVRVTGKGLLRSQLNTKAAGNVKLTIKLGGKAKLALAQTGKAKVGAVVAFLPTDAAPLSKRRNVVLHEAPSALAGR
jgi:hypothetical protein